MEEENYAQKEVTIADEAATSGGADILGFRVVGIASPVMTWVAADLVFEVDPDGSGTYYAIEYPNDGTFARVTGIATNTAPRAHLLGALAASLVGAKVRIRSCNAASEADVNQTSGPITFKLMLEAI